MAEFPQPQIESCVRDALHHAGDPGIIPHLDALRQLYSRFDAAQRLQLYRYLASELESPGVPACDRLDLAQSTSVARLLTARRALDCPRRQLLGQFVNLRDGIKFLVDLRADLRQLMRKTHDLPALQLLDEDLLDLFRGWFNFGFLRLVPINWSVTPAAQLEKIMAQDAVHPMASWAELRRRLDRDRLCYAFYHPNMPDEPLVFVEIALTRTITGSIDRLFTGPSVERIEDATTAIFYSINNTQPGLAGVSLGNSLIKTVVAELQRNWPNLKRFSTLSPMPGFRDRYVEPILAGKAGFALSRRGLLAFFDSDVAGSLQHTLSRDDWAKNADTRLALKPGLLRLAHHYLVHEKRAPGSNAPGSGAPGSGASASSASGSSDPVNPVAAFHLKNGAVLYNINFLSNTSPKGMAESYGLTVNYHYDLRHIDANRDRARGGEVIVSPQLEKMLALGVGA